MVLWLKRGPDGFISEKTEARLRCGLYCGVSPGDNRTAKTPIGTLAGTMMDVQDNDFVYTVETALI